MIEQNAIFEDRFQAWFCSLSPEGRAAALSVKDDDFLSTLIHFASLSSSSPRSNDDGMAEIDGGECFVSRARKKVVRRRFRAPRAGVRFASTWDLHTHTQLFFSTHTPPLD